MVIKLRKFSRNKILKFIAFTLAVLSISISILQMNYIYNRNMELESVFVQEYSDSEAFRYRELISAYNKVIRQISWGTDEILPKPDFLYYVTDGEFVYKNASLDEIKKNDKYLYKFVDRTWEYGEHAYKDIDFYLHEDYTFYLTFPEDYMNEKQESWEQSRNEIYPLLITIVCLGVLAILSIIYLIFVTGREAGDDEVHLTFYMDKIYSDLALIIMTIVLALWMVAESNILEMRYSNVSYISMNQSFFLISFAVITGIATIICGLILLSLVRKIKAGKLLKHSMIYTVFVKISNLIRSIFDNSRYESFPLTKVLNRRQVLFTVISGFLVMWAIVFLSQSDVILGFMLPVSVESILIYWYFYENKKTFDAINQGFNESLQEQMKSERMKVDLITNVSHDLKTPLTSIISYVDLLSKEELPESARDYVNILADKSDRLKKIVSDLFDLAKSTSGNLPLDMENLDLKKLVQQTLGDMEDEIERSDISIRTNLPEMPVYIYSDGNKLYRVFQNIIGNALKYSLAGTRVFIDMTIENYSVIVTIKNTSSYEMNFTAEEVLQRFNRGDKSRTTEGSGLGLSIAESYTWACGGHFAIEVDGDQFKVRLGFQMSGQV